MAERKLKIAADTSLPVDLVTESIAILAIKRAGKSTLARRIVEQLFHGGQQCVVVDPKGDWWGLRYGKDGKSPGLPFVILGGEHGDIQLESGIRPDGIQKNGETIAQLAAVERVSMVIDLSGYRKHEAARFMTWFMETLYRLKAKDEYRTPMMLAIDEADVIAPQRIVKSDRDSVEPRMLGAAEDIVRRGGQRGIGVMLISQRPAVVNKNVLTQCGVLFALRTIGQQDIDAIDEWVKEVKADKRQRDECIDSLSGLQNGEGWIWSTVFPAPEGIFKRTQFLMPDTFDSSATPKAGQSRVVPKNAADVDLEGFKKQLATEIERAKKTDPKLLQQRIAELERHINNKAQDIKPGWSVVKTEEIEQLRAEKKGWQKLQKDLVESNADLQTRLQKIHSLAGYLGKTEITIPPPKILQVQPHKTDTPKPERRPRALDGHPLPTIKEMSGLIGNDERVQLSNLQRSMLIALAQHREGLTKAQILLHTGYASSGNTSTTFAQFVREGWAEASQNFLRITELGLRVLGPYEPLPEGDALRAVLLTGDKLSAVEKAILRAICDAYPHSISKGVALENAGYKSSGNTSTTFAKLLRIGYAVSAGATQLKAADVLFG